MKKTIIMGLVALFAVTSQAGIQSQIATLNKRTTPAVVAIAEEGTLTFNGEVLILQPDLYNGKQQWFRSGASNPGDLNIVQFINGEWQYGNDVDDVGYLSNPGSGLYSSKGQTGEVPVSGTWDNAGDTSVTISIETTAEAVDAVSGLVTIIDDDTMATAAATNVASAESIVAYVAAPRVAQLSDVGFVYLDAGVLKYDDDGTIYVITVVAE